MGAHGRSKALMIATSMVTNLVSQEWEFSHSHENQSSPLTVELVLSCLVFKSQRPLNGPITSQNPLLGNKFHFACFIGYRTYWNHGSHWFVFYFFNKEISKSLGLDFYYGNMKNFLLHFSLVPFHISSFVSSEFCLYICLERRNSHYEWIVNFPNII